MRKLGVEVDCAADIGEARSWWRADLYNLVLIDVENELGRRDKFCEDMRCAEPPQQVAFLVGKPEYLAGVPNEPCSRQPESDVFEKETDAQPAAACGGQLQRWGILEASRRISLVRSASHARSKAMRERPAPPRDSESRLSSRATESGTLDQLLREEKQ